MGALFEFLFKYRPLMFQRGELALTAPWPTYLAAVVVVALAVPTLLRYARVKGGTGRRDRVLLSVVRVSIVALILFSLFRPVLVLSTVVPQRNFVGILLDDSRSMRIADVDGAPRGDFVVSEFGAEGGPLLNQLADRFILRFFRFSSTTERVDDGSHMAFTGGKTDLGAALDRARQELASVPLAGLIVVSDGADNGGGSLAEPLLALQANSIPVHTVGVGRERFERDIEVTRVQTPRTVLKGTSLVVDLMVTQRGYADQSVPLVVEDDGRIVSSQDVHLGGNGEAVAVRVHFTVEEAGPRLFQFRIPEQPGEIVTENNTQAALIIVRDGRQRILYFEGEPRFELKFLRRAVDEDENLQVVTLLRTAENKYYRLGIDDPDELVNAFPKTREELFTYSGLILGSIEASFFTHDQLQMIADFVSQRGGGLLMLGGKRAFVEGGYAGTPVEDVLPVELDAPAAKDFLTEVTVEPTPAGRTHPVAQIAGTEEESAERWNSLPPLTVVNPLTEVKPGATTLLRGTPAGGGDPLVVLAWQRYGRGKSIVFPVQDSWLWQMHADIPLDDMTHEVLWQQLLRWLVSVVPDHITVSTESDRVAPDEPVALTAEVEDDAYLRLNNVAVNAHITSPSGLESTFPMEWTVERDGEYRAVFTPEERGLYEINVSALQDDQFLGESSVYVHSTDVAREYYHAQMQAGVLRRIAEETGGAFYTPETVSSLPEDISYTESGTTVMEEKDLWDMPALFLALLALLSLEWGLRRARGLV
jgi:uncharacterized membrane protein